MSKPISQLEYEAMHGMYYKGKADAYENILRAAGLISEIKPVQFNVNSIQPHK